jgi:hypothetical protein
MLPTKNVKKTADQFRPTLDLALAASQIEFILLWTKDRHLVLNDLQLRAPGSPWRQMLNSALTSDAGVLQVPLGSHSPGALEIRFIVTPYDDIPQIFSGVREGGEPPRRLAPPTSKDPHSLKKSVPWPDEGKFTVTGNLREDLLS